ncbi:MAG: hypothetical protein ACK5AZ_01905 [Bryobacteraceae bacterium]
MRERDLVRASGLKYKVKSFAMPGVEPGAIVEYAGKRSGTTPEFYTRGSSCSATFRSIGSRISSSRCRAT